jgi:phospholipid-translocating ATPase
MEARQAIKDDLESELQTNMALIGGTAVEDKLQDCVGETIAELLDAGVRIWMLTGDKVETAKKIALASGLANRGDAFLNITSDAQPSWEEQLLGFDVERYAVAKRSTNNGAALALRQHYLSGRSQIGKISQDNDSDVSTDPLVGQQPAASPLPPVEYSEETEGRELVLVVQGGAILDRILRSPHLLQKLTDIMQQCKSVVCARVTPHQKASIAAVVKSCGHLTLAVGDGGNDVAMIQEAHVGVGVSGKEGTQASRAADFTISKFSHLRSLLLVHGHQSYARTALIVQYSFYKSMLISFIQLVANLFLTYWSGASYWNSYMLTMWNGLYTLPPALLFCLDRVAPRTVLERYPFLYRITQRSSDLNRVTFFLFIFGGMLQSVLLFAFAMGIFAYYADPHDGSASTHDVNVTVAYSAIIILQFFTVILESHSVTALNAVAIVVMPIVFAITTWIYSSIKSLQFYGVFEHSSTAPCVLSAIGIAIALFMPHVAFKCLLEVVRPCPRRALARRERQASLQFERERISRNVHWAIGMIKVYLLSIVTAEAPSSYLSESSGVGEV